MAREPTLRTSDVGALIRLAGEVGEIPVGFAARADHATRALAGLVGARLVAVVELVVPRAGPVATTINQARSHVIGMDPSDLLEQSERFVQERQGDNPLHAPLIRSREPLLTFRRQQVIGNADWYRGAYFNEQCRPFRSDAIVLSRLARPDLGFDTSLAVSRDLGDRQFTGREQALVHLFQSEIVPRLFARPAGPAAPPLPPRLRPVLDRLLAGDAEKQVALRLGLSPHTVHQYVKAIYKALGVNSRGELLAACLGKGVTDGPQ